MKYIISGFIRFLAIFIACAFLFGLRQGLVKGIYDIAFCAFATAIYWTCAQIIERED